jgi:hypothetical protein
LENSTHYRYFTAIVFGLIGVVLGVGSTWRQWYYVIASLGFLATAWLL